MIKVGIIGASGYTGAELLRLCADHPDLDVRFVTGDTQAGARVAELYPSLLARWPDLVLQPFTPELVDDVDLVFLGLPHGASQAIVPQIIDRVAHVVDLSADFRLHDPALYPQWYGAEHQAPELLGRFVYGLPELFHDEVAGAQHIAVPGCYPTAGSLALAPLVRAGLVSTEGLIVDAASGVSGAGRAAKPNTSFCTVDEDFLAYGLEGHRHTPELDQNLGATVRFTPHLVPMSRGILATCYARPTGATSTAELLAALHEAYGNAPFVVVRTDSPNTKATLGANTAHVTALLDERTGYVVALCALDNLVKGASGQAVQCANLICGLDETSGLPSIGLMP
jgi:N-acetyl-gamma-glutamyl-phosphate reductase